MASSDASAITQSASPLRRTPATAVRDFLRLGVVKGRRHDILISFVLLGPSSLAVG